MAVERLAVFSQLLPTFPYTEQIWTICTLKAGRSPATQRLLLPTLASSRCAGRRIAGQIAVGQRLFTSLGEHD